MKTKKTKINSEGDRNSIAVMKSLMARFRWLRARLVGRTDARGVVWVLEDVVIFLILEKVMPIRKEASIDFY